MSSSPRDPLILDESGLLVMRVVRTHNRGDVPDGTEYSPLHMDSGQEKDKVDGRCIFGEQVVFLPVTLGRIIEVFLLLVYYCVLTDKFF